MSVSSHPLHIIILAAGQGKRMRSALPKVLHPLAGKPLLQHVIEAACAMRPASIHIVYGHQGEKLQEAFQNFSHSHFSESLQWVFQAEQLGTGHAVAQAMPAIDAKARVLVLYGDMPLISPKVLQQLCDQTPSNALGLLTVCVPQPFGYGRVLRNERGEVYAIVEERDATDEQRAVREIFTGVILAPAAHLHDWLPQLTRHNAQGEYYLSELPAHAVAAAHAVFGLCTQEVGAAQGANDRFELAKLERFYQQQQAERLMREGVTLLDPSRFDLRGNLTAAADVVIDINVIIEGDVHLGAHTYVGPHCILRNVRVGEHTQIKANSVLENTDIGAHCQIGPFARIRPGTRLAQGVHVGNFVEIKNVQMGEKSKASHLSYLGDATIGKAVNIGAGTITCNYDGANKHQTVIGDGAFIGSDTQLVAPVTIGAGATIGAGSTITREAPADALTLSRSEQRSVVGWRRPKKKSNSPLS